MDKGKAIFQGENVGKAIDLYYNRFANNEQNIIFSDNSVSLKKLELLNVRGYINEIPQLEWQDDLVLLVELKIESLIEIPEFYITIFDKEQRPVALLKPNIESTGLKINNGFIKVEISHPKIQLSKGIYSINFTAITMKSKAPLLRMNNALSFQMIYEEEIWPPFLLNVKFENVDN